MIARLLRSVLVLFGPGDTAWWRFGALAGVLLVAAGGLVVGVRNPGSRLPFAATIALAGIDVALFAVSGAQLY